MKRILLSALLLAGFAFAKPVITGKVDREDAIYNCGEKATFTVYFASDNDEELKGEATLQLSNDSGKGLATFKIDLAKQRDFTVSETMDKPSFLRLSVWTSYKDDKGRAISKAFTAAFEPTKIAAASTEPEDFMAFWQGELKKANETIPLDAKREKLDKYSNEKHTSYKVSFAAPGGRVYGFLCIPNRQEKMFARVSVPGAGPGAGAPSVVDNYVTLTMNVHPYDPMTPGKTVKELYDELNKPGIYMFHGGMDREKTFFHRPIIGICRAIDWLAALPEVDAKRIYYFGSSQGGAFGFMMGGLNKNISKLICNVPAMCDHFGYKADRAPGWPRYYSNFKKAPEAEKFMPYYDAVNFARHIDVPIRVIVGFVDQTCSPSSVYSAFNAIPSQDKQMTNVVDMSHEARKLYYDMVNAWLK